MSGASSSSCSSRFPETHWSQILLLGNESDPRHRQNLEQLLRRYWKPVYGYVRAIRNVTAPDAEDITQGFFLMMLDRVDFSTLSPERGSFRGFIKTALRRFIVSGERTKKEQAHRTAQPLFPFAEAEAECEGASFSSEQVFDRAWARELLEEMLQRLARELAADGHQIYFDLFRQYYLEPAEGVSYENLARQHGLKMDDVRNYLRAVRQRGRAIMKERIQEYLLPGERWEDELTTLLGR